MRGLLVAALAACGRVGFDAHDAASSPRFVAVSTAMSSGSSVLDVPIPLVAAGDLLAVGVTIHGNALVVSIVDGNNHPLTSAGARAVMASTASEVWFAANSSPTTSITVAMNGSVGYDVWVAEFANLAAVPLDTKASQCVTYPPVVATAKVVTTVPGELVFGATMLAAPDNVKTVAAPFTPFVALSGNGTAFDLAAVPGSYGPAWTAQTQQVAVTCSSTAAFLPSP